MALWFFQFDSRLDTLNTAPHVFHFVIYTTLKAPVQVASCYCWAINLNIYNVSLSVGNYSTVSSTFCRLSRLCRAFDTIARYRKTGISIESWFLSCLVIFYFAIEITSKLLKCGKFYSLNKSKECEYGATQYFRTQKNVVFSTYLQPTAA